MRPAIAVRLMHESDREALREVFLLSRLAAFVWEDTTAFQLEDFDRVIEGEIVLVAFVSGHPVGFAGIWAADSFLHSLFVRPDHQGEGVGKALLQACQVHFTGRPTLKCAKPNEAALSFYHAHGWEVVQVVDAETSDGGYYLMAQGTPGALEC